ncbi:MAG: hypothetical protein LBT09_16055 [Planctomycetaceae bacterium]|nr:hypothetical protein [Planctomycetaceae bacterium]
MIEIYAIAVKKSSAYVELKFVQSNPKVRLAFGEIGRTRRITVIKLLTSGNKNVKDNRSIGND